MNEWVMFECIIDHPTNVPVIRRDAEMLLLNCFRIAPQTVSCNVVGRAATGIL